MHDFWYQVNEFLAGMGTDAPDVEDENIIARPSVGYDDLWAKTLLETTELEVVIWASSGSIVTVVFSSLESPFPDFPFPYFEQNPLILYLVCMILQEDDGRSSGSSSPDSAGSVGTSISSHFGGMNYPSLFSSKPAYGGSQSSVCNWYWYQLFVFFKALLFSYGYFYCW